MPVSAVATTAATAAETSITSVVTDEANRRHGYGCLLHAVGNYTTLPRSCTMPELPDLYKVAYG